MTMLSAYKALGLTIFLICITKVSAQSDRPINHNIVLTLLNGDAVLASEVQENATVRFTCTIQNGLNVVMYWQLNSQPFPSNFTTTVGSTFNLTTSTITVVATRSLTASVFDCYVNADGLRGPLKNSEYLYVNFPPKGPTISGPTSVLRDTNNTWTCQANDAYPQSNMTLHYGNANTPFSLNLVPNVVVINQNFNPDLNVYSYNTIGTVTWAAPLSFNGQNITCLVQHPTLSTMLQATMQVTVRNPFTVTAPVTLYEPILPQNSVITLECVVTGDPILDVTWYKNDFPLNAPADPRLFNGNATVPSLTISNVQIGDSGIYFCRANDGRESKRSENVTVNVRYPPIVRILQPEYNVTYGTSVTLGCTVAANPLHTQVYWIKDGITNIIPPSTNFNGLTGSEVNNPSLTIGSVDTSRAGRYRCYAVNEHGTGNSNETLLRVIGERLTVTLSTTTPSVIVNTNQVELLCSVTGDPGPSSIIWRKTVGGVTSDIGFAGTKYEGLFNTTNPHLKINNIDDTDEAVYQCFPSNIAGQVPSNTLFLNVFGVAPLVAMGPPQTVTYGQTATLQCIIIESDPAPSGINWYRLINGVQIPITIDSSKYIGSSPQTPLQLTITGATTDDSGSYRCEATNNVASRTSVNTTSLTVQGGRLNVFIPLSAYNATLNSPRKTLVCNVSGVPAATSVVWIKTFITNGTRVIINTRSPFNDNTKYQNGNEVIPSLDILNIQSSDQASYECFATNLAGNTTSNPTVLTVTGSFPVVQVPPTHTVLYGNDITLQCDVTATPGHTSVTWYRVGPFGSQTQIDTTLSKYQLVSVASADLIVRNSTAADIGNYVCEAMNAVGTRQSNNTFLNVTGGLLSVNIVEPVYSVLLNTNSLLINCTVTGSPPMTNITWRKGSTFIDTNTGSKYSGGTLSFTHLVINNIVDADEDTYTCAARNAAGWSSDSTFLNVSGSFPIVIVPPVHSVLYGNDITLQCDVTATPSHTSVTWYRVSQFGSQSRIDTTLNRYQLVSVASADLIIRSTTDADAGNYICEATNSAGTRQSNVTRLDVTGGRLNVDIVLPVYSALVNRDNIVLDCRVTGSPPATNITWRKDSAVIAISSTSKYSGGTLNSIPLIIYNIANSDQGTYTCEATNAAGLSSDSTFLNVTGRIPTVIVSPNPNSIRYGENLNWPCTVDSDPASANASWVRYINNQPVPIDFANARYSIGTLPSPTLTITNVVTSDSGEYQCLATNQVGTGRSSRAILTVTGDEPVVAIPGGDFRAIIGSPFTIPCHIQADPNVTNVYWTFNSETITRFTPGYNGSTPENPSLTILNPQLGNSGNYTCYATNIVGTRFSRTAPLSVFSVPPAVQLPVSYRVNHGQSITLQCNITSNPQYTRVWWSRGVGQSIVNISSFGSSKYLNANTPQLTITNANVSDKDIFTCYAENLFGIGQDSTNLLVIGAIPDVDIPERNPIVDYGQTISLFCNVTSISPILDFYWYKVRNNNVQRLSLGGRITSLSPTLTITAATLQDEGAYICLAENVYGTSQSFAANLNINGGRPIVTASPKHDVIYGQIATLDCNVTGIPGPVTVQWQRLTNNGLQTITVDQNKYRDGNVVNKNLIVTNVNFDDDGTYFCSATNDVGTRSSNPVYLRIIGTPATARTPFVYYEGNYSQFATLDCTVSGNPSVNRVTWKRLLNGVWTDINVNLIRYSGSTPSAPSLTITALTFNDEGLYQCFAENSVGEGFSRQAFLAVRGHAPIVHTDSNVNAYIGRNVTLRCDVDAYPPAFAVQWRRYVNGQLIQFSTNNILKYQGGNANVPDLTILNAAISDEGDYVCLATNLVGNGNSSRVSLRITRNAPVVRIPRDNYYVNIDNQATITCIVVASPTETTVYWTRQTGNQPEENISSFNSKYSGANTKTLIINNADFSDAVKYKCYAANSEGTGSSNSTNLIVRGTKPTVDVGGPYNVDYGSNAQLTCSVNARPSADTVYWQKYVNGQWVQINSALSSRLIGGNSNTPSLTIINVTRDDEAFYVCTAINSEGMGQSRQTYLNLRGGVPHVYLSASNFRVLTGQQARLNCSFSAVPPVQNVRWYRVVSGQNLPLTQSGKYNIPTAAFPHLLISNSQETDEGFYVCEATSLAGNSISNQAFLDVYGDTPVASVDLPSYSTRAGTTVTLGCFVVANPAATNVYWSRLLSNGQTINITTNTQKYSAVSQESPSLVISNPEFADAGAYTCHAVNELGSGQSQPTTLSVSGDVPIVRVLRPSYPANLTREVTLECEVTSALPITDFYWMKVTLTPPSTSNRVNIDGVKYSGATSSSPNLRITNINANDEANYYCFAQNSGGLAQSERTFLDVISGRPIVSLDRDSYTVNFGQTITMMCNVTANPAHTTISWTMTKNGVTTNVDISNTAKYNGGRFGQRDLTIFNANKDDMAFYECSASNSVGTGRSKRGYLTVKGDIPYPVVVQHIYESDFGTSARLDCVVQADPQIGSLKWMKVINGVQTDLDLTTNRYLNGNANNPNLTISGISDVDEGYYVCSATNIVGTGVSSLTYLNIRGGVLSAVVPQSTYDVVFNDEITLVCDVSGSPAANQVYWQKVSPNGVVTSIFTGSFPALYTGGSTAVPSLTIRRANFADSGTYRCFARNAVGTTNSSETTLTVIGSAPVPVVDKDYSVSLTGTVALQCDIFARPQADTVSWHKYDTIDGPGVLININAPPFRYSGGSTNVPTLTITNVQESDRGYYTCSANNTLGSGMSRRAYLNINTNPPIVRIPQNYYSFDVGQTIVINCTVVSNPQHNVVWWRKFSGNTNQVITAGGRIGIGSLNNPILTITGAQKADAGSYQCYANNSAGQGESIRTLVAVIGDPPYAHIRSRNYSVSIGFAVTLHCAVTGYPRATSVMWQRIVNGNSVPVNMGDSRYSGVNVTGDASLTISNAVENDEGIYVCVASNNLGVGRSNQTYLNVIGERPQVSVPKSEYTVNRRGNVTLECSYAANPPAQTVTWKRIVNNGQIDILVDNIKYHGSQTDSASLTIINAVESDEGLYICTVTNSVDTGISSATTLIVAGKIPIVTAQAAYLVRVGESETLACQVTSDPSHSNVTWLRVRGSLETPIDVVGNSAKYSGSSLAFPSLIIRNASTEDRGLYVCTASNQYGTGRSAFVILGVSGDRPTVALNGTAFNARYGESITIGCIIQSDLEIISVSWQKVIGQNTIAVDRANTNKYSGSTATNPHLTIINADSSDQAGYICTAVNSVGSESSNEGRLTVTGFAPSVNASGPGSVSLGDTATLYCSYSGNPPVKDIYWTLQIGGNQPQRIFTNGSNASKYSGGTFLNANLTIRNIGQNDAGSYRCNVENDIATTPSSIVPLQVRGNVPVVNAYTQQFPRLGLPFTIRCDISSNPQAIAVKWVKKSTPTGTEENVDLGSDRYEDVTVQNAHLVIKSLQTSDEGYYKCIASNSQGDGRSSDVRVVPVGDGPISVTITPSNPVVKEGDSTFMTCNATATPPASYRWYRSTNTTNSIASGAQYSIVNAVVGDEGSYICEAYNNFGSQQAQAIVDVQFAPKVSIPNKNITSKRGETAQIRCEWVSDPMVTEIMWTKRDAFGRESQIMFDEGNKTKYDGGRLGSPFLIIYNLDANDAGSYRCTATNSVGPGSSEYAVLAVDVNFAPFGIQIIPNPRSGQVIEGNRMELYCNSSAFPVPQYTWFFNKPDENSKIVGTGQLLVITAANRTTDDGLYSCKATNQFGSQNTSQDVDVKFPPISSVKQSTFTVVPNQDIILDCATDANPPAIRWLWYQNGNKIEISDTVKAYTIDPANVGNMYSCVAFNEVGSSSNITFTMVTTPVTTIVPGVSIRDLSPGEIVGIILGALLFLLLLLALCICCILQGCCVCCPNAGRKKNREVIKVTSPQFVEVPAVIKEPSLVSRRDVIAPYSEVIAEPYFVPPIGSTYGYESARRIRKNKRIVEEIRPEEEVIYVDDGVLGADEVILTERPTTRQGNGPELYFES